MSIGENLNLICSNCGNKLKIKKTESKEPGTRKTYTKHCHHCDRGE